jgi:photosystem II stability/assembly factor-like uncharacterized protein
MKYLIVGFTCLMSFSVARAQYLMYDDNHKPITVYDVVNGYAAKEQQAIHMNEAGQEQANRKNIAKGKDIDESGDYQFDRLLWYIKQHTDENGNLVSQRKIWDEWALYKNKNGIKNGRTTGTTNSSNWKFQGPDTPAIGSGLGRISAMAFDPANSNTYWIGSDGGGAWKTTDNGATWTNMTDNLPSLIVSDVDINPKNPNTIYLCTGDRDSHYRTYSIFGVGVLKSYNGGLSWDTTGMSWANSQMEIANCLLINPDDTNCIILGSSNGIFKSMNGGKTWAQKASGNFKQLLYNPADTNVIYASEFYNPSIGSSAQIFRSTDGGEHWTQVTSFVKVCRVGLAVSPANPKIVKALTSSSDTSGNLYGIEGVYSSSDTGHNFTRIYTGSCSNNILDWSASGSHSCGGQGWYDLMIAMDPANANNVYIGGINAWYSTNGGSSWSVLTRWDQYGAGGPPGTPVVHADKHVAVFHPLVPGRFFECNDGGVFYADNIFSGSTTWHDISTGLGITEFYSNAISEQALGVIGGAQDNAALYLFNHGVDEVSGGDGAQCQQDPTDSTTIYTAYVYGVIYRIDAYTFKAPDYPNPISYNIPGTPSGAWITPFVLEPSCNTCIVAGYDQVWQSTDKGDTWNSISPVFFSNRYISNIALSLKDPNTIYAVSADTNIIQVSFNGGSSWNSLAADSGHVSGIEVDPLDSTHIWVCYNGFGPNKVEEYKPSTGWKKLNNNIPNIPVNCIRLDTNKRILYIGTDIGVFYKTDTGSIWQSYSNGMPIVRVTELNISYTRHQLWASTFGRGMWMSPKEDSVQTKPKYVNNVNNEENSFISPNPNNGAFTFNSGAFYSNKRVDMRLVDYNGRTVWSNTGRFDSAGSVQIKTSGLAKGIYLFEAAADNEVIAHKKVVVN